MNIIRKKLDKKKAKVGVYENEHQERPKQRLLRTDHLGNVLNSFADPFFIIGTDLKIQLFNNAALDYCNLSYGEIVGQPCTVVCQPESGQCDDCPVVKRMYLEKKIRYERKGAKDPKRTELIRIYPLTDDEQTLQGAIVRIKDVTEKKKIDEQLILADRLASLNQLSAGIAHEIRNPLAGIMLFVDIMADTERFDRTEQEVEILAQIKESCHKIGDIVTRVLDFAKPVTFARRAISINQLVNRSVQLCTSKMNKANVLLELDLVEALSDVKGERVELDQVMNNLIINSIDAMPDGGTLSITTSIQESAFHSGRTVINTSIVDTGVGIATEHTGKIFSPFFTTKATGTGLGLTISYRIIFRHGGVLYRNNARENGSEFVFELPLMSQEE